MWHSEQILNDLRSCDIELSHIHARPIGSQLQNGEHRNCNRRRHSHSESNAIFQLMKMAWLTMPKHIFHFCLFIKNRLRCYRWVIIVIHLAMDNYRAFIGFVCGFSLDPIIKWSIWREFRLHTRPMRHGYFAHRSGCAFGRKSTPCMCVWIHANSICWKCARDMFVTLMPFDDNLHFFSFVQCNCTIGHERCNIPFRSNILLLPFRLISAPIVHDDNILIEMCV